MPCFFYVLKFSVYFEVIFFHRVFFQHPSDVPETLSLALLRASEWHGARITLIKTTESEKGDEHKMDDVLLGLRAESLSLPPSENGEENTLSLREFVAPRALWRGSLAVYDEESKRCR